MVLSETVMAERRVVADIKKLTGIDLPRLQLISTTTGADHEKLKSVAAQLIPREVNEVVRAILYAVFGASDTDVFFDNLLEWHGIEQNSQGLQVLERSIIGRANKANRDIINACLLLEPRKISLPGIRFLLRQSKSNSALLVRIRDAYEKYLLDLEVLSGLANLHSVDYSLLVAFDEGGPRLSGRHCQSLISYQLPANEYGFRRPALVPYYARVLESTISEGEHLLGDCCALGTRHQTIECNSQDIGSAVRALDSFECVPLWIDSDHEFAKTRAIVLSRLIGDRDRDAARHRKRSSSQPKAEFSQYWVTLIEAPIPPEWNLFPKQLIRPDDSLRLVRPD